VQFLFNYTQIILFPKSHRFGKCSHIIFLYIIGYNNILWRPHDPLSQNLGVATSQPSGLTPYLCIIYQSVHRKLSETIIIQSIKNDHHRANL